MASVPKPTRAFPRLSVIVAASPEGGIGYAGKLPWRLRGDMKFFRQVTTQVPPSLDVEYTNAVIMGRKTWESIPQTFRPLKNRVNIIVSRNRDLLQGTEYQLGPSLHVCTSVDDALRYLADTFPLRPSSSMPGDTALDPPAKEVKLHKVFVIGGEQIYRTVLSHPMCQYVFLTQVQPIRDNHSPAPSYDAFFGPLPAGFTQQSHQRLVEVAGVKVPEGVQTEDNCTYEFTLWESS
ncbi:dihydrofolate reductase [Dispira parvispora]|uniref:Dihydrofolate reductase n=1 Tax=Dispira parvispora TaxID=1520584 RepID=A0A9W8E4G5_9FUNG|nr:dihydrofolate reductase [Dispira parvispora]